MALAPGLVAASGLAGTAQVLHFVVGLSHLLGTAESVQGFEIPPNFGQRQVAIVGVELSLKGRPVKAGRD